MEESVYSGHAQAQRSWSELQNARRRGESPGLWMWSQALLTKNYTPSSSSFCPLGGTWHLSIMRSRNGGIRSHAAASRGETFVDHHLKTHSLPGEPAAQILFLTRGSSIHPQERKNEQKEKPKRSGRVTILGNPADLGMGCAHRRHWLRWICTFHLCMNSNELPARRRGTQGPDSKNSAVALGFPVSVCRGCLLYTPRLRRVWL
jgi:hypothetical protein